MATQRRLHTDFDIRVWEDLAGEHDRGGFSEEQDNDNLTQLYGPMDVALPAQPAPTEVAIAFPPGAVKLRFIAVFGVTNQNGVLVTLGGTGTDPILIKPGIGIGMQGQFILWTSADDLFILNPDTASEVTFSILLGFADI